MNWCRPCRAGWPNCEDFCLNWVCQCSHSFGAHSELRCGCCAWQDGFKFLHNNNCTIECQMIYKVKECSKTS